MGSFRLGFSDFTDASGLGVTIASQPLDKPSELTSACYEEVLTPFVEKPQDVPMLQPQCFLSVAFTRRSEGSRSAFGQKKFVGD